MDYALIGNDLRVKKDVSGLKLYPLFWRDLLSSSADDPDCVDPADRTPCNAGTSAAENTSSANSRV